MLANLHFVNSFPRALQQERWNPWSYSQPFYWLCLQMQQTVAQTMTSKFFLGTTISWKHTASRIGMHVVSNWSLDNMGLSCILLSIEKWFKRISNFHPGHLCETNEECRFWSFGPADIVKTACFLLTQESMLHDSKGWVSGAKDCQ